jgi:hypothetical protein
MKVDLEDLVRDSLREAAGSARLDPHRWEPPAPDRPPRRLRIRVPPLVRSRAAAVLVAVILIAGIGIPLALLSELGGGDEGGLRPGGTVLEDHGLRLELPDGWNGRLVGPSPGGHRFPPYLHAANFSLPPRDTEIASAARDAMAAGQVVVVLIEYRGGANFPPVDPPIQLSPGDFTSSTETEDPMHSMARVQFSIAGRSFDLLVDFAGQEPQDDLLREVNAAVATLEVEPPSDARGYRTEADVDDGLSITIPSEWTFDEDPTQPIEPENVLALGSWGLPSGGVCAPFAALDDLPPDGTFAWLIEYHGTDRPEDFVPRPDHFDLRDFRFGETSCDPTPMHQLRFEDEGRFFQWQVAFGPQASEATEAETVQALDSLEAGGVCDARSDGYVPEITPTSRVAGSQATVSGEFPHGEPGPAGYPVEADTEWVEVWWNLDPSEPGGWSSALPGGEDPIAANSGPVFKLGRVDVTGSCTYELSFEIPDVEPAVYPVVVLQMDPESAAAFQPAYVEVTG